MNLLDELFVIYSKPLLSPSNCGIFYWPVIEKLNSEFLVLVVVVVFGIISFLLTLAFFQNDELQLLFIDQLYIVNEVLNYHDQECNPLSTAGICSKLLS